jgi:hypothetical protein
MPPRAWGLLVKTPGTERLRGLARAALVVEIVLTYVPALRRLRVGDVQAMARAARSVAVVPGTAPQASDAQRRVAVRLGHVVGRVLSRVPSDSRCLVRALVLTRMLARRGIPARLVIGVKPGPPFEAHAWVEHDRGPVLDANGFTRLLDI